jgi:hypothetical protein
MIWMSTEMPSKLIQVSVTMGLLLLMKQVVPGFEQLLNN